MLKFYTFVYDFGWWLRDIGISIKQWAYQKIEAMEGEAE